MVGLWMEQSMTVVFRWTPKDMGTHQRRIIVCMVKVPCIELVACILGTGMFELLGRTMFNLSCVHFESCVT